MFEGIATFLKKVLKPGQALDESSKDTAKERLHLVLMQDRANVSADFLDLMKQEIIDVIKKYVEIDEKEIDVRLTNKANEDGTNGAPALYANIPIVNIKNDVKGEKIREQEKQNNSEKAETEKIENVKSETEKGQETKTKKRNKSKNASKVEEQKIETDEKETEQVSEEIEGNEEISEKEAEEDIESKLREKSNN